MNPEVLLVFLRAPRPGSVKSRLAAAIGPAAALDVYRGLVERVLSVIPAPMDVHLCFTPDDAAEELRPWCRRDWALVPQGAGDLGARLERAIGQAFASGADRVVVIGTDAPEINGADLNEAFLALRETDVVLGPATDGGYWLVGLRQPQPVLFSNIPWSTPAVLEQTQRAAAAAGLRIRELRSLSDIDTAADLAAWRGRAGLKA